MEEASTVVTASLEEVAAFESLHRAARRAARGKRSGARVAAFMMDLEPELLRLEAELLSGRYRPRGYRTFTITFPKHRTISAADFRDRVVHHALCAAMEPVLERFSIDDSYACRRDKGGLKALQTAQRFSRHWQYVLRLDVEHFFETVDHDVLLARLYRHFADPRVFALAERFIRAGAPGARPGRGLPIGNLTSQHFGNYLLGYVDHAVKGQLEMEGYLRYMDDQVLFADDKRRLWRARDAIAEYLARTLRLKMKDRATRLMPVSEGFPFLGFRVWPHLIRFDPRRARRYRAEVRRIIRAVERGALDEEAAKTRMQGLVGWARHGDTRAFRRSLIARLDAEAAM